MGSKARYAKFILPIILKDRKENQYYIEPFVGGCNIMDKVDGLRIGADNNPYLIALWRGLQQGRGLYYPIPKTLYDVARRHYRGTYDCEFFDDYDIGVIGFMGSFNGRFFEGGYSGEHGGRDYIKEQIANTYRQIDKIQDVEFYCCNYDELGLPPNSIIYCDIPYQGTKQYNSKDKFDYPKFWQWCRDKTIDGHQVFISEYKAPDDFECIWQKEIKVSIKPDKTLNQIEKLFKWRQND